MKHKEKLNTGIKASEMKQKCKEINNPDSKTKGVILIILKICLASYYTTTLGVVLIQNNYL